MCYYLLTSDAFPRSLLEVGSGVQMVAYWLIGNPIDHRPVPLDEHILFYIVPMVMGMLFCLSMQSDGEPGE